MAAKKKKISCIVPAYNEGERVGRVLSVLSTHPLIDEVIVVEDGSHDNTYEVIKRYKGIKIIHHTYNKGKSYAVFTGAKKAKNEILMFIDADLLNLTQKDITQLATPVLKGTADVTISLRGNAAFIWKWIGMDFITGERVFHRSLLGNLSEVGRLPGFGLEAFLNRKFIAHKSRIKVVQWNRVESPYPQSKMGFFSGCWRLVKMFSEVFRISGVFGALVQIWKMERLRV